MNLRIVAMLVLMLAVSSLAQTPDSRTLATVPHEGKHPPRFEDFPVAEHWDKTPARVKLTTRAERMFQTELTAAAQKPPNLAGRYRFVIWRRGPECAAGAVIDLRTGSVFPPPLGGRGDGWNRWIISASMFDGAAIDFRINSRLVMVKAGLNYSEARKANAPDEHYFVWEGDRFRQIFHISGGQLSAAERQ